MITKMFLINWVLLLTAGQIDRRIFNDAIGDHKWLIYPFGLWAVLSFISIPIWMGYQILIW